MKILFIIFILLISMPGVYSWGWEGHQNIAEYIYLNLDYESQQNFNVTKLKEGAIMPDRDFKDYRLHHYPKSFEEAEKWLNNDTDIGLNFGIASHYISDSFAAPHNINGEKPYDHSSFEKQVSKYYPKTKCLDYGFKLEDLSKAVLNSEDWEKWLVSKDKKIPQKEVDESAEILFSIILKKLDAKCRKQTEIENVSWINKKKIIMIFFVVSFGFILLLK